MALIAVLGYIFFQLQMVVVAVMVAAILASAVFPVVRWLSNHGWPRTLATLTTFVGILLLLGAIATLVVTAVLNQWPTLRDAATEGWGTLQNWTTRLPFAVSQDTVNEIWAKTQGVLSGGAVEQSAIIGLTTAGEIFTGAVLMVIILFFFLQDAERIWAFLLAWFPHDKQERMVTTGDRAVAVLGGYVRGTAAVAFIEALAIMVCLWILHVPLAIPLGLLMFAGAFVPIVGPLLAGATAALVALVLTGPWAALIVIVLVFVIHHLETALLRPLVMGRSVELPALVILLAIAVGTLVDGVVGAALAVPLTAVIWSAIKVWVPRTPGLSTPAASAAPMVQQSEPPSPGS